MNRDNKKKFNHRSRVDEVVSKTMKEVVYGSYEYPSWIKNFQPDPTGFFPGKDPEGCWYLINWPSNYNAVTNGYAFAMGWYAVDRNNLHMYTPGFLCHQKPKSKEAMVAAMLQDLKECGRNVFELYSLKYVPKKLPDADPGSYWIKVFFCDDDPKSFHVARKDTISGKWIHKPGYDKLPEVMMKPTGEPILEYDEIIYDYETDDKANYLQFDEKERKFKVYKTYMVMRIQN